MFVPDADISPYHPANRSGDDKSEPKVIKHTNTRLPSQMEDSSDSRSLSCPPSPTRSRIDAAIAGTPCTSSPECTCFAL
jgi:protein DGCR14